MTTILMSIRPKWAYKIFTGQKGIEVRKTAPKPPFRAIVYCTKDKWNHLVQMPDKSCRIYDGRDYGSFDKTLNFEGECNGKIIGEFICEKVDEISVHNDIVYSTGNLFADKLKNMCLTVDELKGYLGEKNRGYALGIAAPKLYDKPRAVSEFYSLPKKCRTGCECADALSACPDCKLIKSNCRLTRSPQSWQYVREDNDEQLSLL